MTARDRTGAARSAAAGHDVPALIALADAYLTLHGGTGARVSAHTRRAYAIGIRMLVADWRSEDLLEPSQDAAAQWLRRLEQAGSWRQNGTVAPATPSTVRVRLAAGRVLYRALRWAGVTTADPFRDVRAAPERTPAWEKRRPYSEGDLSALLRVGTEEERIIVLLGAHAGLRVAEMCALLGRDIDLEARQIAVKSGKGKKQRRVSMSSSLMHVLTDAAVAPDAPLVTLTDSGVRKRLARLCERAGVTYRGVHALRHAAGTRLVREGGTLEDAARHLGHSNLETARVYAKWADTRLREQLTGW
jgi:integrase/recombinase XerC